MIKSVVRTLHFIWWHPMNKGRKLWAIGRYLGWQIRGLFTTSSVPFEMIPGTQMLAKKGLKGATGNYYCGLHEYAEMRFLIEHLKPNELFVDVGANVGSYTVLAATQCAAQVMAIEPVAESRLWLKKNLQLNKIENRVEVVPWAIGKERATVFFSSNRDTTNAVLQAKQEHSFEVQQVSLDELLKDREPCIIKIDVEGYEWQVLQGMRATLQKPSLRALIIEMDISQPSGKQGIELLFQHQFQVVIRNERTGLWSQLPKEVVAQILPNNGFGNYLFKRT